MEENYQGNQKEAVYQEVQEESSGITFSAIWRMIVKHWVAIVICGLVGLAGGVAYAKVIKKPKYIATSQIIVYNTEADAEGISPITAQNNAIQGARIAQGYMKLKEIKEATAKYLVEEYNHKEFNLGEGKYDVNAVSEIYTTKLNEYVSSTTATGNIIIVTAEYKDEQIAIDTANAVALAMQSVCNDPTSTLYSQFHNWITPQVTESAKDTSTSDVMISLVGTLLGVVVGVAYAVIRDLTNTHVSSMKELEQITGLRVIGMIPNYTNENGEEHSNDVNMNNKGGENHAE